MSATLFDYYFSEQGMFVIPIEHLSKTGISPAMHDEVLKRERMKAQDLEILDCAYQQYWQRAQTLHQSAGQFWYPPRVQHLCIVTDAKHVRPFFQPFNKNSWLLYASDFSATSSSVELATYLFFHVERMVMVQQILPALYLNLSYFLTLNDAQAQDFQAGCRKCKRPDASAFRALGKSLPLLRKLYHQALRPPKIAIPGARLMPDTGLVLNPQSQREIAGLQQSFGNAAQGVIKRYQKRYAVPSPGGGESICQWLAENQAKLVITGGDGKMLWDPLQPEATEELQRSIRHISASAEHSVLKDLQLVDARSRDFLDSLTCPEQLVDPAPHITEGGLSYIHRERKLIAYSIGAEENATRLWEPSPPYERLMLGARTIHEWGHLAAESHWVRVPEQSLEQRNAVRGELAEFFDLIHAQAPALIQAQTQAEVSALVARDGSLGAALMRAVAIRVEDYMSNLLAQQFLPAAEMDTYVRNNVCSHVLDYTQAGVFMQLARQVYEFQYLRLSRIENPEQWFIKSTWVNEQFIRTGLIDLAQFRKLTSLVGALCNCFEIDRSKFNFSNNT